MADRKPRQRDSDLTMIHSVETQLLKRTVDFFEAYNIRYFAIGGTLLGAVRDGGFIPWDDDVDLAVPRRDYERLIKLMRRLDDDILGMKYYKDDPEVYYYPIKIIHKGYNINDPREKNRPANPWIDVLPIDGLPDSSFKRAVFKCKMMYYRLLLGMHYSDNLRDIERSGLEKIVIKFAQVTKIGRLVDPTKIKNKIDKTLKKNRIAECKTVGTVMGAYFFHEFVPKKYFGRGSKVMFEGIELNAPERVRQYLKHMYGDYMKLPPRSERIVHIDGKIWKA